MSNVKVSEFKFDEFVNSSNAKTKKLRISNKKRYPLDDSTLRSQEIRKRIMNGLKNIMEIVKEPKCERNFDEISRKLSDKLTVFQKAKEMFNRKLRRILQEKNEKCNNSDFFGLTDSNFKRTPIDSVKRNHFKHPTFSYSEFGADYLSDSNSFDHKFPN